ncbi:hypothetical protein D3C78_1056860 [compost metagenome]
MWNTKIILYAKVNTLAIQAKTGKSVNNEGIENISKFRIFRTAVKNISLLKNPENGGKPAMEKLPIIATVKVTGIMEISPPSFRRSRVPVSWSTIPTIINKEPLKMAWLIR